MVTAFQVIMLVILVICGLGSIVDGNKNKHYITVYGLTGVLFLLSVIVNIFAR